MFSAVYLVCFVGSNCMFFVDQPTYPSLEVCQEQAEANIERQKAKILTGENKPFSAEYQCISWKKA